MPYAETPQLAAEADEQLDYDFEVDTDAETGEYSADASSGQDANADPDDALEAAALCPACGELLAWHDEFSSCRPLAIAPAVLPLLATEAPEEASHDEPAADAPEPPSVFGKAARGGAQASYAYELGHRVQPAPALTAEVIWRGQLKERHPATGLIHRVNVYRLNDGYWDCYREEELRVA